MPAAAAPAAASRLPVLPPTPAPLPRLEPLRPEPPRLQPALQQAPPPLSPTVVAATTVFFFGGLGGGPIAPVSWPVAQAPCAASLDGWQPALKHQDWLPAGPGTPARPVRDRGDLTSPPMTGRRPDDRHAERRENEPQQGSAGRQRVQQPARELCWGGDSLDCGGGGTQPVAAPAGGFFGAQLAEASGVAFRARSSPHVC